MAKVTTHTFIDNMGSYVTFTLDKSDCVIDVRASIEDTGFALDEEGLEDLIDTLTELKANLKALECGT